MTHDFKALLNRILETKAYFDDEFPIVDYPARNENNVCPYVDGLMIGDLDGVVEALRIMAQVQEGKLAIVPIKDRGNRWTVLDEIDLTLKYFDEEFPQSSYPQIWDDPISAHAGGISPNDLEEIKTVLAAAPKGGSDGHF